jgi:DNA repair protein RadC
MSDAELLAKLVGTQESRRLYDLYGGSLRLLFIHPPPGSLAHDKCGAARELVLRGLREELERSDALGSPSAVRDYLQLTLSGREHEIFMALMLDAQNRVLAAEELFRGTLTQTAVYPREVVKCALRHNAAGVIFAHNHPTGVAEPSRADELLTQTLKQSLALVDVKVLDHFIVGTSAILSFAERGLL